MKLLKHVLRILKTVLALFVVVTLNGIVYDQAGADQNQIDIQNLFYPSGWMGDGEYGRKYLEYTETYKSDPHTLPSSIRIKYTFGPNGWAGLYWQNKSDNWGDQRGNNYANKGFAGVTFWAKGEKGNEVVEFKAGGIKNPKKRYKDSFQATIGRITLTRNWKEYCIDLRNEDLHSVLGGFCWVANQDSNSEKSITFFLDDIAFTYNQSSNVNAKIIDTSTGEEYPVKSLPVKNIPKKFKARDVNTGKIVTFTFEPIQSMDQLGAEEIGKGDDKVIAWVADHTIKESDDLPPKTWSIIKKGLTKNRVQELLGDPGRIQDIGDIQVWWYKYGNGVKKYVSFKNEKVSAFK